MADGAAEDSHQRSRWNPELRPASADQTGGGQRTDQSCCHHRGLDPDRRGQHGSDSLLVHHGYRGAVPGTLPAVQMADSANVCVCVCVISQAAVTGLT